MNYSAKFENLFSEWKQDACFTAQAGSEHFAKDGIVCPEQWAKEEVKLLFLLKDTHGVCKDDDLLQYLHNTKGGNRATWRNTLRWASLLLDGKPFSGEFNSDDALNLYKRISVMNLKKTPGGGHTDKKALKIFVRDNREYIRREIELISPTHIICCGTWWQTVCYVFPECKIIREIESGINGKREHCEINAKTHAVNFYHPAQTRYSSETLQNEMLLIRKRLIQQTL